MGRKPRKKEVVEDFSFQKFVDCIKSGDEDFEVVGKPYTQKPLGNGKLVYRVPNKYYDWPTKPVLAACFAGGKVYADISYCSTNGVEQDKYAGVCEALNTFVLDPNEHVYYPSYMQSLEAQILPLVIQTYRARGLGYSGIDVEYARQKARGILIDTVALANPYALA
jgi:hypothetical protein